MTRRHVHGPFYEGDRVRYIGGPNHTVEVGTMATVIVPLNNGFTGRYPIGLQLDCPDSRGYMRVICRPEDVEIAYREVPPRDRINLESYIRKLTACQKM
jgi:hypothetical protein